MKLSKGLIIECRSDQEYRVGTINPCFIQLVGIDNDIFPQEWWAGRKGRADRHEVLQTTTPEACVGQDRDSVGTMLSIGLGQAQSVEVWHQQPLSRTLFFDFSNQGEATRLAERSAKRA